MTTGGWSRVTVCACVNLRAAAFAASSELFATYLNTRSRKCDIIKRSLRALRTLGLLGRYSGYALAAGHLRDAGEYTRWASERAQVQLQVSLPTAAVDFMRMRTAKRRLLPAFLPALIAFFLRSMPIFWLAIRAQWYRSRVWLFWSSSIWKYYANSQLKEKRIVIPLHQFVSNLTDFMSQMEHELKFMDEFNTKRIC